LDSYKGPNEEIVIGLASHLRKTLSSTWCLSESGVCGPSRPDVYRADIEGPGYCALAVVGERIASKEVRVPQPKTREENMIAMAEEGLRLLLDTLKAQEKVKT
jgi:nicotinamide mononucleotide (NMN) deamidase PncC